MNNTLIPVSGSENVTGAFDSVYAEAYSNVTVSGSSTGIFTFVLDNGDTFTPETVISSITVNNHDGYVIATCSDSQ